MFFLPIVVVLVVVPVSPVREQNPIICSKSFRAIQFSISYRPSGGTQIASCVKLCVSFVAKIVSTVILRQTL